LSRDPFTRAGRLLALAAALTLPSPAVAQEPPPSLLRGWQWESEGGKSQFSLSGLLMVDAAGFSADEGGLDGGTEVRRGRVYLGGDFGDSWQARAGIELSTRNPTLQDAWLRYHGWHRKQLQVGHFLEPVGMERSTASSRLTFLERALPSVLVPGYHLGVGTRTWGDRWAVEGGLFGDALNRRSDDGWGGSARFSAAAYRAKATVLHLGVSSAYRTSDSGTLRLRARPEAELSELRLADTGRIDDVDDRISLGLEAAVLRGPILFQAEHISTEVRRETPLPSLRMSGWYAFGSWMVTGENRRYRTSRGSFRSVRPQRPWGAVELALRWSTLDLEDRDVDGGTGEITTLGVNWYVRSYARVMLNYSDIHGDLRGAEDPSALQLRVQLELRP